MWWRFLKWLVDTLDKNEKFYSHLFSLIGSFIFSYFFVPGNLSSPATILILVISNFVVVELFDRVQKKRKKD